MSPSYDVAVIGAGHNGLVAANYLARAGRKVIVVEARDVVGGACVSEELIGGSRWSSCAFIAGLLRPEIVADLELKRFGLEMYQSDVLSFSLFRDGSHMFLWKELDRTLREIERYSPRDAQRFLDFGLRLRRFADLVRPWLLKPPPMRSELLRTFEEAGEEDLFNEFVLISTRDLLDRYFESEHLKGLLTFFGMVSIWGGPSTPGTSYVYGHHSWGEFNGEFGQYGFVKGGMGGITEALAAGARHHGVEIRLGSPVAKVVVRGGSAVGIALESGDEISAGTVISNADPKRSLLKLVDASELDDEFVAGVEGIDQRGSMARIHLLIDELPAYLGFDASEGPQHHGHQMLGASVENFEATWEAERRGEIPERYVIEAVIQSTTDPTLAPEGMHTLTLGVQQLPFELADGQTWDGIKESWADKVVAELCEYAPEPQGPHPRPGRDHPPGPRARLPDHRRQHLPRADVPGPALRRPPAELDLVLPDADRRLLPVRGRHASRRRGDGRLGPQRGPGGARGRGRRRPGGRGAGDGRAARDRRPDHGDRAGPQGRLHASRATARSGRS